MTEAQRLRLRGIKSFAQLLEFLRDELDWPIDHFDDEDDLTFDWSDDLGLKDSERIGISAIKQLRPLETGQPWGIFFIDFEKQRLPIVILRRILNALVMKKRDSANKGQRAAWQQHDLLFISAFGESNDRQLTFAHFSEPDAGLGDTKPTLRVLGWDDGDTNLKLDYVADMLGSKLTWPEDTKNLSAWRAGWSQAFELRHHQVIDTAKDLAQHLAALAQRIRNRALDILPRESEAGPLRKLMRGFKEALIHDLDDAAFADMYAQTITYGLFSAAVSRTVPGAGTAVVQEDVVAMVPVTNPFLKEMLQSFLKAGGRKGKLDFDELGIQEVVDLLRDEKTRLDLVRNDFGNKRRDEDPVIHFYEDFLAAYDKKLKIQRGVFYTPQPVVSYIVRSVHELLQTEFGLEDGLADVTTWGAMLKKNPEIKLPLLTDEPGEQRTISPDEPFVQILDPATGTATFLVEVIDVIHRHMTEKWTKLGLNEAKRQDAWNDYVPKHLLPRLHAYELMMAPYAIAHMKIGLKLAGTGYRFGSKERAHVYLTNALEPWQRQLRLPEFEALAHEAEAVNEVKRHKRFTVVMGNPPYAGHSWNLTPQLRQIIEPYRFVGTERIRERGALQLEKNLQDDYVKFICFAQQKVAASSVGILGLVTSHGFLDNVFLRGMRHSLLMNHDCIFILDLHGNVLRGDQSPDGTPDKNVFDIKQTGVAISFFAKLATHTRSEIRHADCWGDRDGQKFPFLQDRTASSTPATNLAPISPSWLFVPQDASLLKEYDAAFLLPEIMPKRSLAVVTGRDAFVIDHSESDLIKRMTEFASSSGTDSDLDKQFGLNSSTWWSSSKARHEMPPTNQIAKFVRTLSYRPFDQRYCFYHSSVFESLRRPVMQHVDPGMKNILLITTRMTKGEPFSHAFVSDGLTEAIGLSSKTSNSAYVFPLFIYHDDESSLFGRDKQCNFSTEFRAKAEEAIGFSPTPESLLGYIYSILYSNQYRTRFSEFLKGDFPRLPLTGSLELFRALAQLGSELVAVHLLESSALDQPVTEYVGATRAVGKVGYSDETVWIDACGSGKNIKPGSNGFRGVPEAVWNFHIGGYQVCEKWLKDRKGRVLSDEDIAHYHKIVVALSETIRLMAEIDEVIDAHGGWPAAFEVAQPMHRPSHSYLPSEEAALLAGLVVAIVRQQPNISATKLEQALRIGLNSKLISLTLPQAWQGEWPAVQPVLERTVTAGSFVGLTDIRAYLVKAQCLKESRQGTDILYALGNEAVPADVTEAPEHLPIAQLLLALLVRENENPVVLATELSDVTRRSGT